MNKPSLLRNLFNRPSPILAVGAHDALSAKLIEEAGFDAIWAGGFGISAAQKCLPDANFLTMTENLEVAKNINEAVLLPVIADCDNGYGNALNVMRTVIEYEKIGIAGISIEDNIFPKQCSFYPGFRRELVSVEEMEGKIRAGQSAKKNPDFLFIARIEALIAGWGMEEALRRGEAYAKAGADAILIHSKSKLPDEVIQFAKAWKLKVPLVVVPTIFDSISAESLGEHGFKVVIFANQLIRSAIRSMKEMLKELKEKGYSGAVQSHLIPLEEVYRLVGVQEMKEAEDQYLPIGGEKTRAIIVSAGFEKDLMPLIEDRPKSMLEIKGKTILERQVEVLNSCNIKDIVVVRGYQSEKIRLPNLRYYENPHYEENYILSSFFCAEPEIEGRVIFLYGDILFEKTVLEKLLQSPEDISLVVDRAWYDAHRDGKIPLGIEREVVMMKEPPPTAYRYLSSGAHQSIVKIGEKLDRNLAHGEFIGMAMFSPKGTEILRKEYEHLKHAPNGNFHEAISLQKASLTDMIQEMIERGHCVHAVDIYKGWMEIDTFEDYQRAWATLK
ncbi:MAG: isocitrate lyase/phosphoenolpyruvate mutase family protein [Chlamydiae bacterium]|nr:isocitrate lyase/phosphoenolpyruvate mutase family protein [Chlamydiota bacterium]MBI3277258.1 isocitrate lyase/phosphoenolpyruvate mutase family protein [Chlamydiota bacterium]